MSDRIVLSGDTLLLPVVLDNESEISAFQCDVFLPQGITVALNEEEDLDVTLNSERATSSHSITARPQDDGCIRLAAYSSQSKKFKGNSGELFYLNLVTDADVEGEMSITLKNIICSTADAEEIAVPDVEALITMAKYIPKNDFILNDTSFLGGTSILLPVGLDNESEISAFQCDIYLPEGITLLLDEEEEFDITLNGERTTSSHSPSARLQDNGSIRLAVYSSQSKKFKGNTGELFYLHLHADKEHFGAQQICIQNIICSTADAKTIIVNDVKNTLTILRPVETLTLDQQTAKVVRNETLTLNATVAPEDADNKEITWTSSDETVATVKDGVVTALKVGEAIITATTTDGTNLTATCTVTVKPIVVSALTLDQQTAEVVRNETLTLTATVTPQDADNKEIVWTSSDETIATVKDGVVTALKVGEAIITATTTDGTNLTATCTVTVKPIVVSSLTLDQQTAEVVRNETLTLTATVTPEDADNKEITWTSSDETIATVKDGVVTALKVGEAIITATTTDGTNLTATCTVTVKPVLLTSITLNTIELTLEVGETALLTATVAPEEADNKSVVWSSSDETVVTVDQTGLVTYVKEGTATITATAADGSGITATCAVVAKPDGIATITSDNIANITYYSIVGEASDTPHKGLNIIKRAYKDGRVEVSKRIIK
ncbi:MAG: Ig-like domain-containing protein [Bacteroidaceae bacterium]|nr:Ig-like domain-containing protein [Bacteroidaceae bacterium]